MAVRVARGVEHARRARDRERLAVAERRRLRDANRSRAAADEREEQLPRRGMAKVRDDRRLVLPERLARRRQVLVVAMDVNGDAELLAYRLREPDVVRMAVRQHQRSDVVRGSTDRRDEMDRRYPDLEGIEIMPYHSMGRDKAARVGLPTELADVASATSEQVDGWLADLAALGCSRVRVG
jgi:hypothetical protein